MWLLVQAFFSGVFELDLDAEHRTGCVVHLEGSLVFFLKPRKALFHLLELDLLVDLLELTLRHSRVCR